jgi:phage shock protein B
VEDLDKIIIVLGIVGMALIGLPWLIFHYITRWKTAATLTNSDERLLEEMYELARRMDERVGTVERIVAADNPNWREIAQDPAEAITNDKSQETLRRIK